MPSPDDFDFWLGTWNVRWGTGDDETGRNVISRAFGGRVVEEQFDGRPGVDLRGLSVSVFDMHHDVWRQTWVDDSGNYFALEGGIVDGEMILTCANHNGSDPDAVYRMRFFDIARRLSAMDLGAIDRRGLHVRGALAAPVRAGVRRTTGFGRSRTPCSRRS